MGRWCQRLGGVVAAGALTLCSGGGRGAAYGIGIRTPDASAKGAAESTAVAAQADEPAAVYYNPAGITQLDGTQTSAGLYAVFPQYEFNGPAGTETSAPTAFLPNFFAVFDLGTDDLRLGLAVNNVFGTAQEWGDDSSLRGLVTRARLLVTNVAPTLAVRLGDHLSVGASFNAEYGTFDLHRRPDVAPGVTGNSQLNGDGWGFGGTVGLLYRINDHHSVGLVYRSPFRIEFDGQGVVTSPAGGAGPSDTTTTLDFPQILRVGYAWRPTPRWTLEADVEWTGWSAAKHAPIRSADPAFRSDIPLNYLDSFAVAFGVEYHLTRHWTLRAGYSYWENSVPTSTFSPLVPDADLNTLGLGIGYDAGRWSLDAAYQLALWEDRTVSGSVNSPAVDGTWRSSANAVMVTFTWRF